VFTGRVIDHFVSSLLYSRNEVKSDEGVINRVGSCSLEKGKRRRTMPQ
jgi:hypothetical protein